MATRGGLRPTSAQRVVESFEAGGEGPVRGWNPFKADHSQHLQELRQKSGAPGAVGGAARRAKTPPALSQLREREREHLVLQSLERLEHKHTAERAVRDLKEVIENCSLEELRKFLRVAFDSKRPLVASKARQQLLLLLRSVVRRFHTLNAGSDAIKALKERVLPLLVHALKSAELTGVVVTTLHDILDCHVPEEDPQMAKEGFLQAGKAILQALMDPLALGMGWDSEVKRRCVSTLAAITPELLRRARQCVGGGEEASDPQVKELLETYARLLVHCLEVSSDLHEGLLQCLLQLSLEASSGLIPFARELAALCAGHLLETPSAPPAYLQVKEMHRPESPPPKRALSRDLALACCDLLQRLAPLQAAGEKIDKIPWPQLRSQVLQALDRENLNLQRLTRGHEKIRKSIKDARQAWDALPESWPSGTADPDEEQLPKTRNRAMQSVLEMRQMEQMEADALAASTTGTPKDGTTPPRRDSGADDEGLALEEIPRRSSSSSWYLQEESNQNEAIRLESELPKPAAAGPVPRTPPPCGAGRLPETVHHEEKRPAAKVDASTEVEILDLGATSSTVDVGTEMTPRPAPTTPTPQRPTKPSKPAFSTEVCPQQRWPRLSPEDCPLLGGILDYLAAGRVDLAMQCIFSVGDEQTLRSVLQRLDSGEVWLQLPSPEAKHLVKLLVALICRDPYSAAAKEACPWLETFLRSPYQALLPSEELPNLQGALFSLSSVGGMLGPMAARIYFHLFQQVKAPQNEFRGRTFATYA